MPDPVLLYDSDEPLPPRRLLPFNLFPDLHFRVPFFLLGQTRLAFPSDTSSSSLRAQVHASPQVKHYDHCQVHLPDCFHLRRDEQGKPLPIGEFSEGELHPDPQTIIEASTISPPTNPANYDTRRVYYARDFGANAKELAKHILPQPHMPLESLINWAHEADNSNATAEVLLPEVLIARCKGEFPHDDFQPLKHPAWFRLYRWLALFELFFHRAADINFVQPMSLAFENRWWVPVIQKTKCSPYADFVASLHPITSELQGVVYARNLTAKQFGDLHWQLSTIFPRYLLY